MNGPETHLFAHCRNLGLAHHVEGHNVGQTPTLHVLHYHPQITPNQITVQEVYNVLVLASLHDNDLVDNQILLGLLGQLHLLDGHALVRAGFIRSVDSTRSTLTNDREVSVHLSWISPTAYLPESLKHLFATHLLTTTSWPWGGSISRLMRRFRYGLRNYRLLIKWFRYGLVPCLLILVRPAPIERLFSFLVRLAGPLILGLRIREYRSPR